ncbi:F-box domain-containing protein [Favolaschia claudopus]|uniref:F-box domain-containing protein n=1 Tax=Favolaschia claudopus TaxID=2862362 RepID=A0AAW0BW64_9AGAR
MLIETLRARIETLDSEIQAQRELLTRLEREKSCVQYQLNMVRDPISRLPIEISSQIFIHSLDGFGKPGFGHIPALFLSVCNSWSSIALGTPELWSAIHITFPCAKGFPEICLDRAQKRPLSIILDGVFEPDVVDTIWNRAQQLEYLEIRLPEQPDGGPVRLALWRGASPPGPFLSLKTFKLSDRHLPEDLDAWHVSLAHVVQLLRLAPNLNECVFDVQYTHYHGVLKDGEKILLPNVRRLDFGNNMIPRCDDEIIQHLSLPKLEFLSIPLQEVDAHTILSFLTTQSPPLKELILGNGGTSQSADILLECLRAAPELELFDAWMTPTTATSLFIALSKHSSLLCRLATLVIHCPPAHVVDLYQPLWNATLDVTTARHEQLKVFHIDLSRGGPPHENLPDANTIAALRILADAGMRDTHYWRSRRRSLRIRTLSFLATLMHHIVL